MRLILIRHGQTPANVGGVLSTDAPGPGLTELGFEQAAALPAVLADAGIERVFVSNLLRTHLTMAPLADSLGLAPVELPGLAEIEAGSLEGRADAEAYAGYLSPMRSWAMGNLSARMPGGPSGEEFFARYDDAVEQIAATGVAVAALVSHGAAIRVWSTVRAVDDGGEFLRDHELDNTGIVTLEGSPHEGWRLISWAGQAVGGGDLADVATQDPTGRG